jgi:hypothetical protein
MIIIVSNEKDVCSSFTKGVQKMNKILTMLLVFVLAVFLSASAPAATINIPDKYNLNNQLEQVHKFWRVRIMDWEAIDNQSLVIQTSPGLYYLLVLTVPSYELPLKMNRIGISNSGSMIREGLDSVIVSNGAHFRQDYPIERIYKISGSQEMRSIINQLQAKQAETHTY